MVDMDDLFEKCKEPVFVLHLFNCIGSIVVFSCIAASRTEDGTCIFGRSEATCGYGTLVSVLAFLVAAVFVCLEFTWDHVSQWSKEIYQVQIASTGATALAYMIIFFTLLYQWNDTSDYLAELGSKGNARAVLFYCFINTFTWAFASYLLYDAYKSDALLNPNPAQADSNSYQPLQGQGTRYRDPVTGAGGTGNSPTQSPTGSFQSADQSGSSSQVHGVYNPPFLPSNNSDQATSGEQNGGGIDPEEI